MILITNNSDRTYTKPTRQYSVKTTWSSSSLHMPLSTDTLTSYSGKVFFSIFCQSQKYSYLFFLLRRRQRYLRSLPDSLLLTKDCKHLYPSPMFSSGIRISSAPAPTPAFNAINPASLPITSTKNKSVVRRGCISNFIDGFYQLCSKLYRILAYIVFQKYRYQWYTRYSNYRKVVFLVKKSYLL